MSSLAHPALERSLKIPEPPRLFLPPAKTEHDGSPAFTIRHLKDFDYDCHGFPEVRFERHIPKDYFDNTLPMVNWDYAARRSASEILPYLYLGPVTAARDRDFLLGTKITLTLGVRDMETALAKLLSPRTPQQLDIATAYMDTTGHQDLIRQIPNVVAAINDHLDRKGGRVLIFCETGNERSALVTAAYILAMYPVSVLEACQIVHAQRFSTSWDDNARQLLLTLDSSLKAQRQIAQFEHQRRVETRDDENRLANRKQKGGTKRSLDDVYPEDVDMEDIGVGEEGRQRVGSAPFADLAEW